MSERATVSMDSEADFPGRTGRLFPPTHTPTPLSVQLSGQGTESPHLGLIVSLQSAGK